MRYLIFLATISLWLVASLILTGCSTLVSLAVPTPSITAVIATSVPVNAIQPTLTPLPVLPSATPTTQPAVPTNTPSPTTVPSTTTLPPSPTIPPSPTNPPPSATKQVTLPELPIFDKDGTGNVDGRILGITPAKTYLSFQAIVCSPDCKSKSDGNDIASVNFLFYKSTAQCLDSQKRNTECRLSLQDKTPIFKQTERSRPYCSFGGDQVCPLWVFAEHGNKWPNGASIENGNYTLFVQADTNPNKNGHWESTTNFTIAR